MDKKCVTGMFSESESGYASPDPYQYAVIRKCSIVKQRLYCSSALIVEKFVGGMRLAEPVCERDEFIYVSGPIVSIVLSS